MKKIIKMSLVILLIAVLSKQNVNAQNNSNPPKDNTERRYLDLKQSVRTVVRYNCKEGKRKQYITMFQFLCRKAVVDTSGDTTEFENILMWVEQESGENILAASRFLLVEGEWVKWENSAWKSVPPPADKKSPPEGVICKIYNFEELGNNFQFQNNNTNNSSAGNGNNVKQKKYTKF